MHLTRVFRLTGVLAALSLAIACDQNEAPQTEPENEPTPETTEAEMSQDDSGRINEMERVVAAARFELAARLDIGTDAIEVAEARRVTWRNGALGCPREDGMYTQALVEGFYVRLVVDGQDYPYHAGRDGKPFYCEPERSQPPAEEDSQPAS